MPTGYLLLVATFTAAVAMVAWAALIGAGGESR
jgi:hypothetical protein